MSVPGATNKDPVLISYDTLGDDQTDHPNAEADYFKGSADNLDSYTQGIELSNACRRFYVSRVQVAEGIKSRLDQDMCSSGHASLDSSMGKLRKEVVSLIDQDLSLMKQLLTLNERIEDLKWQRKLAVYNPASTTTCCSSQGNMLGSDGCMLSDWEGESTSGLGDRLTVPRGLRGMQMSDKDLVFSKYMSPSNLSMFRDCTYSSNHGSLNETSPGTDTGTSRNTQDKLSRPRRSTSDLGSSDELVNSVSDVTNNFRVSQADYSISMDCPSNTNSLRKSDQQERSLQNRLFNGGRAFPKTVSIPVSVENDGEDDMTDTKEYSHDSGIQVVDHNMEMII